MAKRVYGAWAGDPKGTPEDTTRCIETVQEPGRGIFFHQCRRKRGFGPKGLYCKQHDPAEVKRRDIATTKRRKAAWDNSVRPHDLAAMGVKLAKRVMEATTYESECKVMAAALLKRAKE